MYTLRLSLRGGADVGKHTHTDGWTYRQKDRINTTLNENPLFILQWLHISLKDRRSRTFKCWYFEV